MKNTYTLNVNTCIYTLITIICIKNGNNKKKEKDQKITPTAPTPESRVQL